MGNCKNYFVTLQLDIMISWKKKKKNSILGHTHQWEMSHFFSLIFPMNVYHSITSLCNLKSWNTMLHLWQNWKKICIFNLQFNNNVFQFHKYNLFPFKLPFFSQLGSIVFAYRFMLLQMYFSVTWCESRRQLLGNEISIVQTSSYGNYRSMFVLWWYSTVRNLGH